MKKIIIILVVVILAGAGYYFYSKSQKNMTTDTSENTNTNKANLTSSGTAETGAVTEQEKISLQTTFNKIASLFKSADIIGIKKYFTEAGLSDEEIAEISSGGLTEKNIETMYALSFKDVYEKNVTNEVTTYTRGQYTDGSEYVEMKISGVNSTDKNQKISIVHTFDLVQGKWYWMSFDSTISGT